MNKMLRATCEDPESAAKVEQFAARCAHDLNNLLTGVLGNLELMQNRARRSGIKEFDSYLEGARHAAGRAAEFTQRLMAYSGHAAQEPMAVPVNALLREVVELGQGKPPRVTVDLAEDAGEAFCDPAQLELALLEVLANARQAAGASGEVSLRSRAAAGTVTIAVADNGPGMTPEVLARAAEPFFSTRQSGAGKGLGLAIVENFARQAGGGIGIDSTPGGTTVMLTLPKAAPPL